MSYMRLTLAAICVVALSGCPVPAPIAGGEATFTGQVDCVTSLLVNGAGDVVDGERTVTVMVADSGLPILGGREAAVGVQTSDTFGALSSSGSVVDLETGGEIRVAVEGPMSWCGSGCFMAGNGVCDEPDTCVAGTDCEDCGPYTRNGTATFTYERKSAGRLHYTAKIVGGSDEDEVTFGIECEGTLER